MVSAPLNQSWIGRDMIVTSSPDAAFVGRTGLVVDETRETITMLENNREVFLARILLNSKSVTAMLPSTESWYGSALKIEYTVTKGVSDYYA